VRFGPLVVIHSLSHFFVYIECNTLLDYMPDTVDVCVGCKFVSLSLLKIFICGYLHVAKQPASHVTSGEWVPLSDPSFLALRASVCVDISQIYRWNYVYFIVIWVKAKNENQNKWNWALLEFKYLYDIERF